MKSLTRRSAVATSIRLEDLRSTYNATKVLVLNHWIVLGSGRHLVCDASGDGPIIIKRIYSD